MPDKATKQAKHEKRLDLGKLATFVPNKRLPVYNWFYYKEGYSKDLVMLLLDKYTNGMNSGSNPAKQAVNVLDPFTGSGTTQVACKECGLDSYGFDVSPLAVLSSQAKTNDYDSEDLKKAIKFVSKSKFKKPDCSAIPKDIKRFFNNHTLDDVLFFRDCIDHNRDVIGDEAYDFLKLGLITSTTRCSYQYKDGAVLKVRKKPVPVFRKFYLRTLRMMLKDLQRISFKPCQTFVDEGDARNLKIDSNFIDLVITSPPYLNKIEYTKVYGIEEFLFFNAVMKKRGIRSYIGTCFDDYTGKDQILQDEIIPLAANAYFSDMKKVFSELRRACKPDAVAAFVVGDGCFPGRVVHVDALLPKIAEQEGFDTENIYTLNERWCTKNRVEKVGKTEENLMIFRML